VSIEAQQLKLESSDARNTAALAISSGLPSRPSGTPAAIPALSSRVSDGIVTRRDFREIPQRVEYALTEFGVSLVAALRSLCDWGREHMERIEGAKGEAG
jgi:hypothetical protein